MSARCGSQPDSQPAVMRLQQQSGSCAAARERREGGGGAHEHEHETKWGWLRAHDSWASASGGPFVRPSVRPPRRT